MIQVFDTDWATDAGSLIFKLDSRVDHRPYSSCQEHVTDKLIIIYFVVLNIPSIYLSTSHHPFDRSTSARHSHFHRSTILTDSETSAL